MATYRRGESGFIVPGSDTHKPSDHRIEGGKYLWGVTLGVRLQPVAPHARRYR